MDEIEPIIEDYEEETPEEVDEPTPEPKPERAPESPEAKKARLTRELARLNKQLGDEEPAPSHKKTDELDETQLDYLDLKGVTDDDEIELIRKVVTTTGQTVRQALKDDYVVDKLEKMRAARAVKDATPSTKRHGAGSSDDLASAIAKFDATNELPSDFALRSQVVNAVATRSGSNKPSWG